MFSNLPSGKSHTKLGNELTLACAGRSCNRTTCAKSDSSSELYNTRDFSNKRQSKVSYIPTFLALGCSGLSKKWFARSLMIFRPSRPSGKLMFIFSEDFARKSCLYHPTRSTLNSIRPRRLQYRTDFVRLVGAISRSRLFALKMHQPSNWFAATNFNDKISQPHYFYFAPTSCSLFCRLQLIFRIIEHLKV